jgi:hypothetical protein
MAIGTQRGGSGSGLNVVGIAMIVDRSGAGHAAAGARRVVGRRLRAACGGCRKQHHQGYRSAALLSENRTLRHHRSNSFLVSVFTPAMGYAGACPCVTRLAVKRLFCDCAKSRRAALSPATAAFFRDQRVSDQRITFSSSPTRAVSTAAVLLRCSTRCR